MSLQRLLNKLSSSDFLLLRGGIPCGMETVLGSAGARLFSVEPLAIPEGRMPSWIGCGGAGADMAADRKRRGALDNE
jgi:hypothetical protein